MWGEVKFWAGRNIRWILLGAGLLVLTLGFILITQFSSDRDRLMSQQAQEVEETQLVVEEQQQELLGDTQFSEAVNAIPTESEIIAFLNTNEQVVADESYVGDYANELIYEEYGFNVGSLASQGKIVSEEMTADQRLIIQLYQEMELYNAMEIEKEDLLSYTVGGMGSIAVPKPAYNVEKYIGQRVNINANTFGIFNHEQHEYGDYLIMMQDTSAGFAEMGYLVDGAHEFGDITLTDGFVAKVSGGDTSAVLAYLIFKPSYTMSGEELAEKIGELDIRLNGSELTTEQHSLGFLQEVNQVLSVQIVDTAYIYSQEDGYNAEEEVTLTVNGDAVGLNVAGIDFEVDVNAK